VREVDKPFAMPIEDIFSISGRGTVVTGRVERGKVKVEKKWRLWIPTDDEASGDGNRDVPEAAGTKGWRETTWVAAAGNGEGRSGARASVVQAGVDHAAHEVQAEAYVLTKEEGGRHTPFFTGYRPQFYFRTTDVTGDVKLPTESKW